MISIPVAYEDESIIVVDKPSGLVVNKADTARALPTLQEWAEEKLRVESGELRVQGIGSNSKTDFYLRGGIVHRLDKETSGLLVIAKDEESFLNLQKQFKERKVEKSYQALVHGRVVPKDGEINVPIGRLPWDREKFGVVVGGREAKTVYHVLKYFLFKKTETLTLLEASPKTGRTHQIRVHLKYLGYPIFSDAAYGGRKVSRNDRKILPRHFLHATKLKLAHPKNGKSVTFELGLPKDLIDFLAQLT